MPLIPKPVAALLSATVPRPGVGPYEFFTPAGVLVYLHDTDFWGLVWLPGAEARFYFVFDAEWVPAGASRLQSSS